MNGAAKSYLASLETMGGIVYGPGEITAPDGSKDQEKGRTYYAHILRLMDRARVFDVGKAIVVSVAEEIMHSSIKAAHAEEDFARHNRGEKGNNEDVARVIENLEDQLSQLPFPIDLMPFDECWFGFGNGFAVDDSDLHLSKRRFAINGVHEDTSWFIGAILTGVLVTKEGGGRVDAVMLTPLKDPDEWGFITIEWAREGRWLDWFTLWSPWLIWAIMNILNDSRTVVASSPGWRKDAAQIRRKLKLPGSPKPYYEVTVEPRYVKAKLRENYAQGAKVWTHRHDRRAHERCRVRRGPLPLPQAERADLLARGYAVYEQTQPQGEDARRIGLRGFPPKRSDEWIAILPYWVQATIVGPEDLPYVPSVHVVKEAIEHPEAT